MEKQRRINTLVICGLLIVVGAMTIGFAALNQRLDIEGTATVKNGGTTVAKYKGYTLSVGGLYHQRIMIVIKQKLVYLLFRLVVVLLTGQILILLLIRLVLDRLLLLMVIILLVVVIHITLINRTKLVLFFILCFR